MASSAFILIVIGVISIALSLPFVFSILKYFRWRAMPTLHMYLSANPQCQTSRGIKCSACNSGSIKNWGLTEANDKDRVFICNHCGTNLYRN